MDVKIFLADQNSFKWTSNQKAHVLGHIFDTHNHLLTSHDFLEYCKDVKDLISFERKILKRNGSFSVIIRTDNDIFIAVDSTRTFPLFYLEKDNSIFISDSSDHLQKAHNLEIDKSMEIEFLTTGYVTKDRTLLKGLFQVQAGEFVKFSLCDGLLQKEFYTDYLIEKTDVLSDQDAHEKNLQTVLDNALDRMLMFSEGRPFLVPLSGGYDSRLIACMLKKRGVENVICYTYGAKDSHEVLISKKVADALGYKWLFVEYNDKTIPRNYVNDAKFQSYYKYASNHSSVFLLQDYFAIKEIKEKKLTPDNCIVIPGHSADFLAGSHLSIADIENRKRVSTIKKIFHKHYILNKPTSLTPNINNYLLNTKSEFEYSVDDNWNLKERQSKFIINSVRIYEFFGFKHYLLFWDFELQEFFKELPVQYKIKTKLYLNVAFTHYFEPLIVDFVKDKSRFKNLTKKIVPSTLRSKLQKKFSKDFNKFELMKEPLNVGMHDNHANINSYIAKWYIREIAHKF